MGAEKTHRGINVTTVVKVCMSDFPRDSKSFEAFKLRISHKTCVLFWRWVSWEHPNFYFNYWKNTGPRIRRSVFKSQLYHSYLCSLRQTIYPLYASVSCFKMDLMCPGIATIVKGHRIFNNKALYYLNSAVQILFFLHLHSPLRCYWNPQVL